jgi:hypothetical protein
MSEQAPPLRICSLLNKYNAIEGAEVSYVDLQRLIRSKITQQEQDRVDIERLRFLTAG